ncbi:hypothetical protein QOT17_006510 [Balamuthia mandrillaris]
MGTSYGNNAEYAVINQALADLLSDWGCGMVDQLAVGDFRILAKCSTSLDDLQLAALEFFSNKDFLKVMQPCNGLVLLDAAFFASDEQLCLITVQQKTEFWVVTKTLIAFYILRY